MKKTLLLLLLLPILIFAVKKVIDIRKGASGTPVNIIVDTQSIQGNLQKSLWQNFSQGGEEPLDMISPIIPQVRTLSPELIRIDHVFDYYNVDQGNGTYDFSRLDLAIDSILKTGAKPLISLSYTTPDQSKSGQSAGEPKDWNQWSSLIKATAHHYSVEKNISGIYYEVWNEPDLFGGWHYGKDPNYSTLYVNTAKAVAEGAQNSSYKIGGPATTAYYQNWIKSLFKTASSNGLRLDFISWHKYSKDPSSYGKDIETLNEIIADYPQYFDIERIITEIGPNPEPDAWYDSPLSGIHQLALVTELSGKAHRLFSFELVDGPSPRSDISTGWGLITHPNNGTKTKPRYYAYTFLNLLNGQRLSHSGDGSWVTALASKNGSTIQVLLVNYDQRNNHSESFPLTLTGLSPGKYQVTIKSYLGQDRQKTIEIPQTIYTENIYLEANSAQIWEFQKL